MAITVATSYADSTAVVCSSTSANGMRIDALCNPSQTGPVFVQLFDSAAPTFGVTAPILTVPIQANTVEGGRTKEAIVVGNGGVRCTTALSFFVTNSSVANTTAAAGTDAPQEVRVFWLPI